MAKETRSWEANDGSLHKSECDAVRRDLQLLIADSPCAENSPYAKTMLEWMTSQPREIAKALEAYAEACPKEAMAAEPELVAFEQSAAPMPETPMPEHP